MSCVPLEDLSALLDGELPAADAASAREHVASCAACRETLARLSAASGLVRALPREQADAALAARVAATARRRRMTPQAWSALAAAAALVAFGVFFFEMRSRVDMSRGEAAPARAQEGPRVLAQEPPRPAVIVQEASKEVLDVRHDAPAAKAEPKAAAQAASMAERGAAGAPAGHEEAPSGEADLAGALAKDDASGPQPPAMAPAPPPALRAEAARSEPERQGEADRDSGLERERPADAPPQLPSPAEDAKTAKHNVVRARAASPAIEAPRTADEAAASTMVASGAAPVTGGVVGGVIGSPAGACGRVRDTEDARPVEPGPGVEPPVLLTRREMRLRRGQGPVTVRAIVELDGTTSACEVSGASTGEVAREASWTAGRFTWRPARVGGRPHAAWVTITFAP